MKATTLVVLAVLCILLGSIIIATSRPKVANADSAAPPSAYTGAPGELGTCANCHTGISGTGFVSFATTGRPGGYIPGGTDTILVYIQDPAPTQNRWGFEVTILKNSDYSMAGSLSPLAFHGVHLGTAMSGGRTYLSQRSNGASAPLDPDDGTRWGVTGATAWAFEWSAPPVGSGGVTVYISAVAANGDGAASGADNTYTITQYLPEQPTTPVASTTWGKIKQRYR